MSEDSSVPLREDRPTERLVDLAMFLQKSERGYTREEIGRTVPYYQVDNVENFGRMFERDKVELMSIGFDIELVQGDVWNQDEFRYRIVPSKNLLPEIDFTEAEMKALIQATKAWRQSVLHDDALQTKLKLEAIGVQSDDDSELASFTMPADLRVAAKAIAERRILKFFYRKPGQTEPDSRELEPWGLILRFGAWYVYGFDRLRKSSRCFNLARVTSPMTTSGNAQAYEIPADVNIAELFSPAYRGEESVIVRLRISEGHGQYWRSRGIDKDDFVEVELDDLKRQIPLLAADAPHVVVVAPSEVREAVVSILKAVR